MKIKILYFSKNNYRWLYITLCIITLLLGGIIYIFFRESEPVFFRWFLNSETINWIKVVRQTSLPLRIYLPYWIIFSLPDGLWAFAYSMLITNIWIDSKSRARYFWMANILIFILGFEILQYLGILNGTFCIQDLILEMAGAIFGFLLVITLKNKNDEKVPEKKSLV
jgi:hypothetical protein